MKSSGGNISRAPVWGWLARAGAVFGLLIGLATPALAQTGTVTGRVLNAATGQALGAVRVSVEGTRLSTQTRPTGEFTLTGVPAGQQRVVAQGIGYSTLVTEVVVTLNQPVEINFQLNELVFSMDEIVVTGTAGQARRREIGNSLEQVTAADIAEAPIQNVGDILQGRAAGVMVMDNSGQPGAGNAIRLRGNNSVSQGNQPLVYVDGVRVSNESYRGNGESGQDGNPLNDINPDDVERVEVVKGAAATTLYGTEAAGGVIQIFTKKGSQGAAQWNFNTAQGVSIMGHVGGKGVLAEDPTQEVFNPSGLGLNDCTGVDPLFLPIDPSCPESGSWFRPGRLQNYSLSVRGGDENTTYFVSGLWGNEDGIMAPGGSKNWSARGNFTFQPSQNLQFTFSNSYANRTTQWIPDGDNAEGMMLNVLRGDAGYTPNNEDGLILDMKVFSFTDHYTTGAGLVWTPGNGMTHRINVGFDLAQVETTQERPWGYFRVALGNRESIRQRNRTMTFDYAGTWQKDLSDNMTSTFSLGGQMFDEQRQVLQGLGEMFAGPGEKIINSGARTTSWESRRQIVSGGFFLQEMVGVSDRLFVTAGLRVDGHSSFGENFGLAPYPKLSASYILSDSDFWPEFFETLKLRAAIGSSGKAPGAFDRLRTWSSIAADEGQAGVTPSNPGDRELGPEKTREWEVGFEGSMFEGRVGLEFTYYDQLTTDALISVPEVPSGGFTASQLRNIGKVSNSGSEFTLNLSPVRGRNVSWDLGLRYSTNKSRVLDLGGLESISASWRQYIRVCSSDVGGTGPTLLDGGNAECPLPGYWHDVIDPQQDPNEIADPTMLRDQYLGSSYPTHSWSIDTNLELFNRLSLNVLGEAQGGHVLSSGTAYQNTRRLVWPECRGVHAVQAMTRDSDPIVKADGWAQYDQLTAFERAKCWSGTTTYGMWIAPADFFKLRSASLSYRVPENIIGGGRSATVRFQARNLFILTDYPGLDPEALQDGSRDWALFRQEYYNLPPPRSFMMSLSVNF